MRFSDHDIAPRRLFDFSSGTVAEQWRLDRKQRAMQMRENYGLDKPIYVRYFKWVTRFFSGDFGESWTYGRPVAELVGSRMLYTLVLIISSVIFTWVLAIPIGVYSATHQYSWGDNVITFVGFVGLATPGFLLALVVLFVALYAFGVNLTGLFSARFETAPWSLGKVGDLLSHLVFPTIVTAASDMCGLIRVMRGNLLDVLGEQYIRTARAKGLRESVVVWKHAVRVAINPLISTFGMTLTSLVSGGALIGIVLNLQMAGPLYLQALHSQDMFLAGFFVMFFAVLLIVGNIAADIALAAVDPRIRYD